MEAWAEEVSKACMQVCKAHTAQTPTAARGRVHVMLRPGTWHGLTWASSSLACESSYRVKRRVRSTCAWAAGHVFAYFMPVQAHVSKACASARGLVCRPALNRSCPCTPTSPAPRTCVIWCSRASRFRVLSVALCSLNSLASPAQSSHARICLVSALADRTFTVGRRCRVSMLGWPCGPDDAPAHAPGRDPVSDPGVPRKELSGSGCAGLDGWPGAGE